MRIDYIVCPDQIEAKLEAKHNTTLREARQVLLGEPRVRFAEKGNTEGEDVYVAFGRTYGGRYLAVFFIYKPDEAAAVVISAREMSSKERKGYGRK